MIAPAPSQHRARRPGLGATLTTLPGLVLGAAVGILLVGRAYRLAAEGAEAGRVTSIFWVGMILAVLPPGLVILRRQATVTERCWALALVAVVTAVPKYLRNPAGPLYHDEYAHWRQATDVLETGRALRENLIIPIVQSYPGTSVLTVGAQSLSGLQTWDAGVTLVLLSHLLSYPGVMLLGLAHLRSARAAGAAALAYGLNPSALYFSTQYAYESLTITWFIWVLALTSLAARETSRARRRGLVIAAVLCYAGCVVTHHLTTVFLTLLMVVMSLSLPVLALLRRRSGHPGLLRRLLDRPLAGPAVSVPSPATSPWVWAAVTLAGVAMAVGWTTTVARRTLEYLSPYAGAATEQLGTYAAGDEETGRSLLSASSQPLWEKGMAALVPFVLLVLALVAVRRVWPRLGSWSADTLVLMAFGLVYFPSVLFILAPMGAEGARRSWGFTSVGLALLIGVGLTEGRHLGRSRHRPPREALHHPLPRAAMLLVLLVGGTAAGLNGPYRFPGPFTWGTDTTSASVEAQAVAEELAALHGPVLMITDRYTRLAMSGYGGHLVATSSWGFPASELVQLDRDPSPDLTRQLRESDYRYLVVDLRMTQSPPYNGDNFGSVDALAGRPTPMALVDRLDRVSWASRVQTTDHLRVYRVAPGLVGTPLTPGEGTGGRGSARVVETDAAEVPPAPRPQPPTAGHQAAWGLPAGLAPWVLTALGPLWLIVVGAATVRLLLGRRRPADEEDLTDRVVRLAGIPLLGTLALLAAMLALVASGRRITTTSAATAAVLVGAALVALAAARSRLADDGPASRDPDGPVLSRSVLAAALAGALVLGGAVALVRDSWQPAPERWSSLTLRDEALDADGVIRAQPGSRLRIGWSEQAFGEELPQIDGDRVSVLVAGRRPEGVRAAIGPVTPSTRAAPPRVGDGPASAWPGSAHRSGVVELTVPDQLGLYRVTLEVGGRSVDALVEAR